MINFTAALFDELTPIYPDTNASCGTKSFRVAACNGMYTGVHIMLNGIMPGIPVTVEIFGPHRSYKTFLLRALPVEVNTGAKQRTEYLKDDVNENVIRRAPFMIYDVLEPFYKIFMPQYTTSAIAVKIPVEYCRKKRTQTFNITVTHGEISQCLTLFTDEYPLSVPKSGKDTFKYVNWFTLDHIADAFCCEKWSEKFYTILERYMRAAAFSRQNVYNIETYEVFTRDENGRPVLEKARLKRLIDLALRSGMAYLQGGAFAGRNTHTSDNDAFFNSLDHENIESPDEIAEAFKFAAFDEFDNTAEAKMHVTGTILSTAEGESDLRSMASQLYAFLKENNLCEIWTQCCLDEPNPALEAVYRKINSVVREEMPGIELLEPTLVGHPLEGTMDIWCPTVEEYENNIDFYTSRIKLGEKVWVYACLTPGANYCNRLLDMERLRQVWLGWAPAHYSDISGFLHWGGTFYQKEGVYNRQCGFFAENVLEFHPKYAMFLPAGDGCIFFPGHNFPLICTRSEAQRIGLEDLCLLEKLKEKGPEMLETLMSKVFRSFCDFEKDTTVYRKVKRELLETLLK